jgi:hypothetical protein
VLGSFALAWLAAAGWFYARNWIELGVPFVGNWNLPGAEQRWWQQPGFHTPAYYLGFGEALRHPYLAGFHSFADGIYSTLWGDGGIGGRVFPADRHPLWNYGFMSIGYWLALPATALALFGGWRCVRLALSPGQDPGRRAALSFLCTASYAMAFAILFMTVSLPFFAQAKAFYGLALTAPLGVFLGAGATRLDAALAARGWLLGRALLAGAVALTLAVFLLGFAG